MHDRSHEHLSQPLCVHDDLIIAYTRSNKWSIVVSIADDDKKAPAPCASYTHPPQHGVHQARTHQDTILPVFTR